MAIVDKTVFGELLVALTDEKGAQVELSLAGLEFKYSLYISTVGEAVQSLREAADWLEKRQALVEGFECDGYNCPPRAHDHKPTA